MNTTHATAETEGAKILQALQDALAERAKDPIEATDRQLDLVDCIYARMLADFADREAGEIKDVTIRPCGRSISISVETGLKGDEGTLAAIFARTRAQVFVGPRGGLRAFLCGRCRPIKLWQVPHLDSIEREMKRRRAA